MRLRNVLISMCFMTAMPVFAEGPSQQQNVYKYCADASVPLLTAGTYYVTQTANKIDQKIVLEQMITIVTESARFKGASKEIKVAMVRVLSDIEQPEALIQHQKKMMEKGENYLAMMGYSWAYKTVSPFTAWCNFNHFGGNKL